MGYTQDMSFNIWLIALYLQVHLFRNSQWRLNLLSPTSFSPNCAFLSTSFFKTLLHFVCFFFCFF